MANFLTAFRRRMTPADIGGYGGGNLQDQLDEQDPRMLANTQPNVPVNAPLPAPREAPVVAPQAPPLPAADMSGTRPRMVAPTSESAMGGPPPAAPVVIDPVTGRPDRKTIQALNPEGGLGEYYSDLQKWEPRGGKRGLKHALKTGAMYAAEAVQRNPEHPIEAAIAGFGTGAIGGTAAPNFQNRLRRQWELGKTGQELQGQLGLRKEQAQIDALQSQSGIRDRTLNERQVNDALSQYNRLEHYDPNDPADAGLTQLFKSRGLNLPQKDKYHRPVASWVNGNLVLTDSEGTRVAQIEGKPVQDVGRTPNAQGLNPNQAAIQASNTASRESRESEGALNRKVRIAEGAKNRSAALQRTKILAGVQVGKLGDPDVYEEQAKINDGFADDLEAEAETLKAEHPTAAGRLRKQAQEFRQGSQKLRTAASGARGARQAIGQDGQTKGAPKFAGRVITQRNLEQYAKDHEISLDEAKKVFEGAQIVP